MPGTLHALAHSAQTLGQHPSVYLPTSTGHSGDAATCTEMLWTPDLALSCCRDDVPQSHHSVAQIQDNGHGSYEPQTAQDSAKHPQWQPSCSRKHGMRLAQLFTRAVAPRVCKAIAGMPHASVTIPAQRGSSRHGSECTTAKVKIVHSSPDSLHAALPYTLRLNSLSVVHASADGKVL